MPKINTNKPNKILSYYILLFTLVLGRSSNWPYLNYTLLNSYKAEVYDISKDPMQTRKTERCFHNLCKLVPLIEWACLQIFLMQSRCKFLRFRKCTRKVKRHTQMLTWYILLIIIHHWFTRRDPYFIPYIKFYHSSILYLRGSMPVLLIDIGRPIMWMLSLWSLLC